MTCQVCDELRQQYERMIARLHEKHSNPISPLRATETAHFGKEMPNVDSDTETGKDEV